MFDRYDENVLLLSTKFIQHKEYWLDKLSGDISDTRYLISDDNWNRGAGDSENLETTVIDFPGTLRRDLSKLCKQSDHSLYIVLLAVLKSLIYLYMGKEDIIVCAPLCQENISRQTLNTKLIIRDRVRGDMRFKELVMTVRESVLDAYENQDYPYNKLVEHMFGKIVQPDRLVLSNVFCLLKNIHAADGPGSGETGAAASGRLVFSFERGEGGDDVSGCIRYDSTLYDDGVVQQLSRHFTAFLQHSLSQLDAAINDLPYMSERERERLLFDFNDTRAAFPAGKTLHRLFEEQVQRTPDSTAVVHHDRQLTYASLNGKANRLARLLQRKGVGADSVAGIIFERSPDMIIAMMGVLKAGGAYLPLDPKMPEKRLVSIVEQCQVSLLLVQEGILKQLGFTGLQGLKALKAKVEVTGIRP